MKKLMIVIVSLLLLSSACFLWLKKDYTIVNSRTIIHQDQTVYLNFPLESESLSKVDRVLIDSLKKPPKKPIKKILIDPGHGGKAVGAIGKIYQEKNLNLAVAMAIKSVLVDSGFEVIMTRTTDFDLTLAERAQMGKKVNADLLISIHHNARGNNTTESGIESYTLTAPMALSSGTLGTETKPAMPGNAFDIESFRCAFELQKHLSQMTQMPNRGIKHARFAVLAQAECPAVLLELGFISTPREEMLLGSEANHQKVANAVKTALENINHRIQ